MDVSLSAKNNKIDVSSTLADDFFNSFNISKPVENDPIRPHPKFSEYCPEILSNSLDDDVKRLQNKRRIELLDNLDRKRQKISDELIPLVAYIEENIETNNEDNKIKNKICEIYPDISKGHSSLELSSESVMQVDQLIKEKTINNKRNRNGRNDKDFRNIIQKQLMLSEWLVDVPDDFYTNWYMKCCPRGKRTLVIAANGRTRVYSRAGYFLFQLQSLLPGGCQSPSNHATISKNSILDCVYVESEFTFYVLDVLTWNGCSFQDCETEFRFFWLNSRLSEVFQPTSHLPTVNEDGDDNEMILEQTDETSTSTVMKSSTTTFSSQNIFGKSICNLYEFVPLQYHDCTVENISRYAKGPYQFKSNIDGILFYHKRAPYVPGITPLVCWLKVNMIPKILNIRLA